MNSRQEKEKDRSKGEDEHLGLVGQKEQPCASTPIGKMMLEDWKLEDCKLKSFDDCWLRGELVPNQQSCVPFTHRDF